MTDFPGSRDLIPYTLLGGAPHPLDLPFLIDEKTGFPTTNNFKNIKLNHIINLEKSLKFGHEVSGHFVQGHVDTTSKLIKKCIYGKSWYLYFSINKSLKKFLNYKSSIAINGVSLTIAKVFANSFLVVVIPHTLKLTNLKNIKKNDIVNIEIDIIAKYIKNLKK